MFRSNGKEAFKAVPWRIFVYLGRFYWPGSAVFWRSLWPWIGFGKPHTWIGRLLYPQIGFCKPHMYIGRYESSFLHPYISQEFATGTNLIFDSRIYIFERSLRVRIGFKKNHTLSSVRYRSELDFETPVCLLVSLNRLLKATHLLGFTNWVLK